MDIPELVARALPHYSLLAEQVIQVRELPSGINTVFLIETADRKLVLKYYLKLTSPQLEKTHQILVQLIQNGAKIPPILTNKAGEFLTKVDGYNFDLSEFIEHLDHSDQIHISKPHLKLAGQSLANFQKLLNTSTIAKQIPKVDYQSLTKVTLAAVTEFDASLEKVLADCGEDMATQAKVKLLKEIIDQTNQYRSDSMEKNFPFIFEEEYVPTHGDFSMVNTLFTTGGEMYLVDWDGLKLRPQICDLQAALSLFSCKYSGNAYIVEPDLNKLRPFLESYLEQGVLDKKKLRLLPQVAKWNFSIYWLSYTLPAVLAGDFRLLSLIPENIDRALYWPQHYDEYVQFVETFA